MSGKILKKEVAMKIKSEKIEIVLIESLIPHPKNPNSHSDAQIEMLCRLIEYQGFRNPIIVQKGTNLIVAGHGRIIAAKKLGMKTVPVIYEEFESEAQLYAYVVSDNSIGKDEWSKLNLDQIKMDIIDFEDFDINDLGLKDFEILDGEEIEEDEKEISDEKKFLLVLELKDENELMMFFNEMQSREVKTRIME